MGTTHFKSDATHSGIDTFNNPVQVGDNSVGGLGTGKTVLSKSISLAVTAATTTDYNLGIPLGATLLRATVYTGTAYGAVTDAKVSIGSTLGGVDYVAQTSVKAIGVVALTLVNAAAASLLSAPALAANVNLYTRITQSGGNSATGAATMVIEYIQN